MLTVKVLVIKAILTHDTQMTGLMDPFISVKFGNQSKRQKTIKGGGDMPQFNQKFQFIVNNKSSIGQFHLIVYDQDLTKRDLIGQVDIDVPGFVNLMFRTRSPNYKINQKWFSLKYDGNKPAGKILLDIQIIDEQPPKNNQSLIQPIQRSFLLNNNQHRNLINQQHQHPINSQLMHSIAQHDIVEHSSFYSPIRTGVPAHYKTQNQNIELGGNNSIQQNFIQPFKQNYGYNLTQYSNSPQFSRQKNFLQNGIQVGNNQYVKSQSDLYQPSNLNVHDSHQMIQTNKQKSASSVFYAQRYNNRQSFMQHNVWPQYNDSYPMSNRIQNTGIQSNFQILSPGKACKYKTYNYGLMNSNISAYPEKEIKFKSAF